MFAFEFAILLITSLGIMARYALSLTEKYILHKEALRRKAARAIERAAAAERRQSLIEQIQRRRAAGEAVEDPEEEDDDDDDDDDELDVGGWEDKGTWVFYSELSTGMPILDFLIRVILYDTFPLLIFSS
jgi:E3 ubiquitin-protein ligase synoviolin